MVHWGGVENGVHVADERAVAMVDALALVDELAVAVVDELAAAGSTW